MENQDSDIMINLGIDFGTRFTKVCFFAEEFGAHVVNFGESGLATALIPSFVSINKKGQFSISNFLPKNQERCYIFNLRMASMGLEELDVYSNLSLVDGKCEKVAKCLTAFYLANVIDQAKILIKSAQHKNINGRNVIWSASVGIPVAYAESKLAHGFQEVLAVAWKWAEGNLSDKHTSSLESLYERSLEGLHPSKSPCQAYPSIAAAFFPFAKSKGVNGGIYVYFEVGSSSLEGALLKLRYNNEEMQIDFLSADSKLLGIDQIVNDIYQNKRNDEGRRYGYGKVKRALLTENAPKIRKLFLPYSKKVAGFAGEVICLGKKKDYQADWKNGSAVEVFLGGSGRASFYKESISHSYKQYQLSSLGIPEYHSVGEIACPQELNLGGVPSGDYYRFHIAYGLSRQLTKRVKFKLPGCFPDISGRTRRGLEFESSNPGGHGVF